MGDPQGLRGRCSADAREGYAPEGAKVQGAGVCSECELRFRGEECDAPKVNVGRERVRGWAEGDWAGVDLSGQGIE